MSHLLIFIADFLGRKQIGARNETKQNTYVGGFGVSLYVSLIHESTIDCAYATRATEESFFTEGHSGIKNFFKVKK